MEAPGCPRDLPTPLIQQAGKILQLSLWQKTIARPLREELTEREVYWWFSTMAERMAERSSFSLSLLGLEEGPENLSPEYLAEKFIELTLYWIRGSLDVEHFCPEEPGHIQNCLFFQKTLLLFLESFLKLLVGGSKEDFFPDLGKELERERERGNQFFLEMEGGVDPRLN